MYNTHGSSPGLQYYVNDIQSPLWSASSRYFPRLSPITFSLAEAHRGVRYSKLFQPVACLRLQAK